MTFPEKGRPAEDIIGEMRARSGKDVNWRGGKTAVYVFNAGEEVGALKKAAWVRSPFQA